MGSQSSFWWQQLPRALPWCLCPAEPLLCSPCTAPCPRPRCHLSGDICVPALALLQHIPRLCPLRAVPQCLEPWMGLDPRAQLILVPPRAATWQQGWPRRWRRWHLPGSAAVTALHLRGSSKWGTKPTQPLCWQLGSLGLKRVCVLSKTFHKLFFFFFSQHESKALAAPSALQGQKC